MNDQPARKPGIVDLHAHWYVEGALAEVARADSSFEAIASPDGAEVLCWRGSPTMHIPPDPRNLAARLASMDAAGVELEVLSTGVLDLAWAGSASPSLARRINATLAEVCRQAPGRFHFVASLPLED